MLPLTQQLGRKALRIAVDQLAAGLAQPEGVVRMRSLRRRQGNVVSRTTQCGSGDVGCNADTHGPVHVGVWADGLTATVRLTAKPVDALGNRQLCAEKSSLAGRAIRSAP